MCLNLTYRKHVKIILPKLFARYPNPRDIPHGAGLQTQQQYVGTTGHVAKRDQVNIRKMTEAVPRRGTSKEASDLHGIGKYGSDSYQIFFLQSHIPA